MRERVQTSATPRRTLGSLILLLLAMGLVNLADLPGTGPRLARLTGGCALLDVRFFYGPAQVQATLQAYGTAGRNLCLRFYETWDVAIPLLAWIFSSMALGQLWRSRYFRIVPLAAMSFDFLENLSITALILRYPDSGGALGAAAGMFTLLKWIAYAASLGLILTGLGRRWRSADHKSAA